MVNGQDKIFKCFWTGYGSRCQSHRFECQELQRCWDFHAQQFPVCIKNGPPPKGHPANWTQLLEALESIWASIPVERFGHYVESIPRRIDWGVQLNIRKVFLMFCRLSVFLCCPFWCNILKCLLYQLCFSCLKDICHEHETSNVVLNSFLTVFITNDKTKC